MTKRLLLILVIVSAFLMPTAVSADEGITLLDSSAKVFFPSALEFHIEVDSASDIIDIRLHYYADRMNFAHVVSEAWPDFSPASTVSTKWVWDMRRASLPVGAKVNYWWTIEDSAGNELTTEMNVIQFDDFSFEWQTMTEGKLNLFWYEGDTSFARELMAASQDALVRIENDTGANLDMPVNMYIYGDTQDLLRSMIFPREWTGGVAFTEYSTIAIGISPKELDWGRTALAHELGHMVTHQITFSPYGSILPTWLDEGLAMHAEGQTEPVFTAILEEAIEEDALISVRSLSSPFSAIRETAVLSYAQSHSIVEFLIQKYGKEKMLSLLVLFKEGSTDDEALMNVFGFDQAELDELWYTHLMSEAGLHDIDETSLVLSLQTR